MKKVRHEFWVTNIHPKKDISLGDLRLTIRKGESRNLLDSRHYTYTLDQLEESVKTGSIKKRSRWIKVRNLPPRYPVKPGRYQLAENGRFGKLRYKIEIEEKDFKELHVDKKELQEQFAADDADIVHNDNAPALSVDEQYKKNEK